MFWSEIEKTIVSVQTAMETCECPETVSVFQLSDIAEFDELFPTDTPRNYRGNGFGRGRGAIAHVPQRELAGRGNRRGWRQRF